ncbi:LuxR C-terminal-related transcriptional regulator [Occultella kanbiaonis]|uniref:LuxR C-terminal-related transcriptional regulator n=1 Tax=Occultella kanbiaonis TaxID=2675754 RepID=UPI0012B8BA55|nr:LuxR C-terminal-related transcriptional regulator [Occultella kanbiaonis]
MTTINTTSTTTTAITAPARVERTQLLARIATGLACGSNIVAIIAPAGSGKTTVLDQLLDARRARGDIVLSLPAPHTCATGGLWPTLLAAIHAASLPPGMSSGLMSVLRDAVQGPGGPGPTRPLDPPAPVWVCVDDAHAWSGVGACRHLAGLLSLAQPLLRVAIGARHTPHGLISTSLLNGSAHEYRSADLAFDRDEARALLAIENIDLVEADLGTLLARTDGWAAGLRLAALAMGHRSDRSTFVRNFAGTDRTVADYLVTEVLSSLPQDDIELLLDVSSAERINLDLARALTGRSDVGERLEGLVASNALVRPVRDEPAWYELHPLLRSYLRAESQRRDENRHRRHQVNTIDWFETMGDLRGAIRHAVAAADWSRAESLTAASCLRIAATDGPEAMRDLLRSLPAWLQARPAIAGAAALTAVLDENLAAAELDLAILDAATDDPTRRAAYQAVALLASARTRPLGPDEVAGALAALETEAGRDPDLVLLGRSLASMALAMLGDLDAAATTARSIARISRARGLDFLLFRTLGAKCAVATFRSDVGAVRAHASEAIDLAERRGWYRSSRLAQFHGELALAEWQSGDDATAAHHARVALEMADPDADPLSAAAARCIFDLTVGAAEGGLDLGTVADVQAFNDLWPSLPPAAVAAFACFELMVTLRCHEVDLAGSVVRRAEEVIPGAPDVDVFKAMRHVYQGHGAAAQEDLDRVRGGAFLTSRSAVVASAISAQLADETDRPARSHETLLEAVRLAEQDHLMRCLLDAAPSVRNLLLRGRGRFGRHEGFVAEILTFASTRPYPDGGTGLVLTSKELAVLRDLPSMLSLREIADAHVVSVNTVKTHVRSVYRKLGVATRREAVVMARQTGLL